jgi:hypothetical protein
MPTHKFAVGDRVRLVVSKYAGDVPPGIYTISRKLPIEANVCQYRVKHVQDGHERVVQESQLAEPGTGQG